MPALVLRATVSLLVGDDPGYPASQLASAHPTGTVQLSPANPVDRGGRCIGSAVPAHSATSVPREDGCHSWEHDVPVQPFQDPAGHNSSGCRGRSRARASPPGAAPA